MYNCTFNVNMFNYFLFIYCCITTVEKKCEVTYEVTSHFFNRSYNNTYYDISIIY